MSDLATTAASMLAGEWRLRKPVRIPVGSSLLDGPVKRVRAVPQERYEVRLVIDRRGTRPARKPVSWHLKKERAIERAKEWAAAGHDMQVVWTHADDKHFGEWLDDADVVWDSYYEEEGK